MPSVMSEASGLGLRVRKVPWGWGLRNCGSPGLCCLSTEATCPCPVCPSGRPEAGEALVPVLPTAGQSENVQRHSLSQGAKQGRGGGGRKTSHQGQVAGGAAGDAGPGPQAEVVI